MREETTRIVWSERLTVSLLYGLSAVFFFWFVVDQVLWRHVHVDEFQQAANAQIIVRFSRADLASGVEPWMVPYGLLTQKIVSSMDVVVVGRAVFAVLALCCLVALGQSQTFDPSRRGRAVATCALVCSLPLWRHGIEVRHDFFQLPAAAAAFWLLSMASQKRASFAVAVVAGTLCALAALNCLKAVVVFAPLLVLAAAVSGPTLSGRLWVVGGVAVGGLGGIALTAAGLWITGHGVLAWQTTVDLVRALGGRSSDLSYDRFDPWSLSAGFIIAEPLLVVGLILTFVSAVSGRFVERFVARLLLAPVATAALFLLINPTPYPYNMIAIAPFLVLAGVASLHLLAVRVGVPPEVGLLLVILQLATTGRAVLRDPYLTANNSSQAERIAVAEALTGPGDPVLDGVGMVSTRPPATNDWLLHSALMRAYMAGRRESFAAVLQTAPPVVITNYRWAWLPADVAAVLERSYVKLANDLWVLSPTSDPQTGTVRLARAGRYLVDGDIEGPIHLDNVQTSTGEIVKLPAGTLRVAGAGSQQLRLVWVGPQLSALPAISPSSLLFVPEDQPY